MPDVITPPPTTQTQTSSVTPSTVSSTQQPNEPVIKTDDLLKRMAEEKSSTQITVPSDEPLLSSSDIEKIQDPFAKKVVNDLYKHLQTGFNKKFEKLSEERKSIDKERQALNTWSPERIDNLLKDQSFIQAAQNRIQQQTALQAPSNWQGSQESWSALTESEKQAFTNLETKVNNLLVQQDHLLKLQDDERIRQRVPNYNPSEVDQLAQDIQSGRVSSDKLRELAWKGLNHDKNIVQSYRLGLQDRNGNLQEKRMASSPTIGSSQTQSSSDVPVKQPNESPQNWFRRIGEFRLSEAKQRETTKR